MTWNELPTEMKQAVVDRLALHDSRAFAKTSHASYLLCVPALYRDINLHSPASLQSFLRTVPSSHCRHVRTLSLNLSGSSCAVTATNDLTNLLERCTELLEFSLRTPGVLKPSIVQAFAGLRQLQRLSIRGCVQSDSRPLSERLVTSIALTLSHTLTSLSLSTITRSAIHAPELVGAPPFIPVVSNDHDVPFPISSLSNLESSPPLSSLPLDSTSQPPLCLPTLLLLPHLRELRLTDTHLGDPAWETTPVRCMGLEVVEVGGCCEESAERNGRFAERVVRRVAGGRDVRAGADVGEREGMGVRELVLGAGVSSGVFADSYGNGQEERGEVEGGGCDAVEKHVAQPTSSRNTLPRLNSLTLTALLPLEDLLSTLEAFSASTVEVLNLECHVDDVEEECEVLSGWLGVGDDGDDNDNDEGDEYTEGEEEDREERDGQRVWCASPTSELSAFDWGVGSSVWSRAQGSNSTSSTSTSSNSTFSSFSFSSAQSLSARSSISSLSTATTVDSDCVLTPVDGAGFLPLSSSFSTPTSSHSHSDPRVHPLTLQTPTPPPSRLPFPHLKRLSLVSVDDVLDAEANKKTVFDFDSRSGAGVLEMLKAWLSKSNGSSSSSSSSSLFPSTTSFASAPTAAYHIPLTHTLTHTLTLGCSGDSDSDSGTDQAELVERTYARPKPLDFTYGYGSGIGLGDLKGLDEKMVRAMRDVRYETW